MTTLTRIHRHSYRHIITVLIRYFNLKIKDTKAGAGASEPAIAPPFPWPGRSNVETTLPDARNWRGHDTADMVFTVQVDGACCVVASVEHHYAGYGSCHRGSRSKHKWYGLIMKSRPLGSEDRCYQSLATAAVGEWCRHRCQPVARQCRHPAAPENAPRRLAHTE